MNDLINIILKNEFYNIIDLFHKRIKNKYQ